MKRQEGISGIGKALAVVKYTTALWQGYNMIQGLAVKICDIHNELVDSAVLVFTAQ
jgi:hypothetical protein